MSRFAPTCPMGLSRRMSVSRRSFSRSTSFSTVHVSTPRLLPLKSISSTLELSTSALAMCEAPSSPTPVHARCSSLIYGAVRSPDDSSRAPRGPRLFQLRSRNSRHVVAARAGASRCAPRSVSPHLLRSSARSRQLCCPSTPAKTSAPVSPTRLLLSCSSFSQACVGSGGGGDGSDRILPSAPPPTPLMLRTGAAAAGAVARGRRCRKSVGTSALTETAVSRLPARSSSSKSSLASSLSTSMTGLRLLSVMSLDARHSARTPRSCSIRSATATTWLAPRTTLFR
mmetsp:Transcript_38481/g.114218  ORF Transcript_38481/g.114218 Transcript_38481/m.114218 type:complete len:284 (-) Transcript_38481:427-1278(-)